MKLHRPSPALIVAIVALVVALGGTAVATKRLLITSSHQIANGAIRGKNLHAGTITGRELSHHLLVQVVSAGSAPAGGAGSGATEAHRAAGPEMKSGGEATVATLDLQPGVYAVFAKTNLTPNITDNGL